MHEENGEEEFCFICFEDNKPLFRICNCNTMIHHECFQKMASAQLLNSNTIKCSVCKYKFEQNTLSHSTLFSVNLLMLFILIFISSEIIVAIILAYSISAAASIPVIVLILFTLMIYIYLQYKYKQQTGKFSWIALNQSVREIEIKAIENETVIVNNNNNFKIWIQSTELLVMFPWAVGSL